MHGVRPTAGSGGAVIVASGVTGSPAECAGIRSGDVIVRSQNRTLHNSYDWYAELLELRVGENDSIVVKRGGMTFRMPSLRRPKPKPEAT